MLSWVEFSVVVSGIGIGILSFSDPHGSSLLTVLKNRTSTDKLLMVEN